MCTSPKVIYLVLKNKWFYLKELKYFFILPIASIRFSSDAAYDNLKQLPLPNAIPGTKAT